MGPTSNHYSLGMEDWTASSLAHSNVVQGPPNPPTQNYSFSNCQVNIYNNATATPHHQQDVHVAALRDVTNRPS